MSAISLSPDSRVLPGQIRGAAAGRTRRPVDRAAPSPSVRLTRRGRLVVFLLLVALACATLLFLGDHSAATDEQGAPARTRVVVIDEGDTLWDVASSVTRSGDVREMVHRIQELNAMTGAGVVEGQRIAVPWGEPSRH